MTNPSLNNSMSPQVEAPGVDDSGVGLFEERVESVPVWLLSQFEPEWRPKKASSDLGSLAVTGLGSSEAHARYLVSLCSRYTQARARFIPLVDFAEKVPLEGETLVLFSQGLSHQARLVLDGRHRFRKKILFTAVTESGLIASGRPERARLLRLLIDEGGEVVRFPLEDEYTILIRIVGPACGFLAARLWAEGLSGSRLSALEREGIAELVRQAPLVTPWFEAHVDELRDGFIMLAPSTLLEAGQNLVCKFVEGLFWPAPQVIDYLSFAHGAFQQLVSRPRPVILLAGHSDLEHRLSACASSMCERAGLQTFKVPLASCPTLSPIEVELAFNPAVLRLARRLRVQQTDWPGKGLDHPLYAFQ